jgi:hypothetical protein
LLAHSIAVIQAWLVVRLSVGGGIGFMAEKNRLLILRGAGSSVEYGIPGTAQINNHLLTDAAAWADRTGQADFYKQAWHASFRDPYYTGDTYGLQNFEDALALMPRLMYWKTQKRDPFSRLLLNTEFNFKTKPIEEYDDFKSRADIFYQYTEMIYSLGTLVALACSKISPHDVDDHRQFLQILSERFNICIFDLNYDNISDLSFPSYFDGFRGDHFFARDVHAKLFGGELYHLHGSIYFDSVQDEDGMGSMIIKRSTISTSNSYMRHNSFEDERFDNLITPRSSIITGGFKTDQILGEPFSTYFSSLIRRVNECDAILICGYGFTDQHINGIIENRMRSTDNCPAVMILDYCHDENYFVDRSGIWAYNVRRTFRVSSHHFFRSVYKSEGRQYSKAYFKGRRKLEVAENGALALWRYGFRDALKHADLIKDFLSRAPYRRKLYHEF